jgi:hypothetical protein
VSESCTSGASVELATAVFFTAPAATSALVTVWLALHVIEPPGASDAAGQLGFASTLSSTSTMPVTATLPVLVTR